MNELRRQYRSEILDLPEVRARVNLVNFLKAKANNDRDSSRVIALPSIDPPPNGYKHTMTSKQVQLTLDAAMATFALHVEARIAALVGRGYYTIGPCGEELLAGAAHALNPTDSVALHYRHLGINVASQLLRGISMEQVLNDRARGYTVSQRDPVTGGVHCAIGSGGDATANCDYVVTSTLASQCPSAVGRALGFSIRGQKDKTRPVSFVTVGDGSVHNHHFLSAYHLSRHARHKLIKCPVVFGISDNGLSISYKTKGYVETMFPCNDELIPRFSAHGGDMFDVYDQTVQAFEYSRNKMAPAVVIYRDIVRRFGHAATDRQRAYLGPDIIRGMSDTDVLAGAIVQAVETLSSVVTYAEIRDRFQEIQELVKSAFDNAVEEDKVTKQDMIDRVSQKLVPVPRLPKEILCKDERTIHFAGKLEVMRKHMTRVIGETLEDCNDVVYVGEDVEHGGYYLVTDGLAERFPGRVLNFPPDETTLLGVAMGFSHVGLLPIVEIPYAKYLDCGADMFYEIAIMNWLTNGQRPNGMVIRLQGFGRGLFGGNFHTHNMLPHIPPGVDVVCYSNGEDYVRGFRNAIVQAKNGRVVVLVDFTHLLNLRHLHDRDRGWERPYPEKPGEANTAMMNFNDVRRYGVDGKWAIVSFGDGVVVALQARRSLLIKGHLENENELDVIDCPYLSSAPNGLRELMKNYEGIIFADSCKEGPGSVLSSMIVELQGDDLLPNHWGFVGGARTYNPLASCVTFLNVTDVEDAFAKLLERIARAL